jgi:hypothetical protein
MGQGGGVSSSCASPRLSGCGSVAQRIFILIGPTKARKIPSSCPIRVCRAMPQRPGTQRLSLVAWRLRPGTSGQKGKRPVLEFSQSADSHWTVCLCSPLSAARAQRGHSVRSTILPALTPTPPNPTPPALSQTLLASLGFAGLTGFGPRWGDGPQSLGVSHSLQPPVQGKASVQSRG